MDWPQKKKAHKAHLGPRTTHPYKNISPHRRRLMLHIPRFRLLAKALLFRCSSASHRDRSAGSRREPIVSVGKCFSLKKTFPPIGVVSCSTSLASTYWRKLSRFAAPPLLTATAPLGRAGSPSCLLGNVFPLKKHFPPSTPTVNGGFTH